jgi:hypothetical protein
MRASSIRIDRPVERKIGTRNVINDRLGFHLDELDPTEMRGIKGASAELEKTVVVHGHSLV